MPISEGSSVLCGISKRRDAEKATARIRVEINDGAQSDSLIIELLLIHYKREELLDKAHATIVSYTDFLDNHIVPKRGECS